MFAVDEIAPPVKAERTPCRVFRSSVARDRLDRVAQLCDAIARDGLGVVPAYSLKTNPRHELLELARERGFFAEAISPDELRCAENAGFPPARTIYNGPYPLSGRRPDERVEIAFADSLEAVERNARLGVARICGMRLRPSMLDSRFGIPLEDDRALAEALTADCTPAGIGVSFHARREDFHGAGWRDVAADVLERAVALQAHTGRPVVAFDAGGGWTPDEFDATAQADLGWLVDRVAASLAACTRVFLEPGQAVCTPVEALIATVLEVRERGPRREIVVDAGYPDWPQMHSYPHDLFAEVDGGWAPVGSGPDRMLGRTCLEYDLIGGLRFPASLRAGARVLIADTGSYDRSMAFDFAHGGDR